MSDARIDRLEQEVRSLRRALTGMAVLSLALGSAVVASCSKSAAPPTKLAFKNETGGEVTLDASGLTIKDEQGAVQITSGRVSADHVQVRTANKDTGGSVEIAPDQVSLHTGAALVTLYVSKESGARIQMADDDSHADITTKDDAAAFALQTPNGKVKLDSGKDAACARLERQLVAGATASAGDAWTTCAPPGKP